jgi:hypothetical protein
MAWCVKEGGERYNKCSGPASWGPPLYLSFSSWDKAQDATVRPIWKIARLAVSFLISLARQRMPWDLTARWPAPLLRTASGARSFPNRTSARARGKPRNPNNVAALTRCRLGNF